MLRFCELSETTSDLNENEVVTIEITLKSGKRCIVSSMYRAPNTTPQIFHCCYNSLVCTMKKMKPYAMIIGLDHNMDFLKSVQHGGTNDFIHGNLDMGLVPTIAKPTRITKSSATLIDNIIVSENLCGSYSSNILINDMSDHMPTICILESLKMARKDKIVITSRDTRPKNIAALKKHLRYYNWPDLLRSSSLHANMEALDNLLQMEFERCTPVKSHVISSKALRKEPWVTSNLKMCIDKNKRLYCKTLKRNSLPTDISAYQDYNKCLKKAIRVAKRLYHCNKCEEYQNNTKMLWKVINDIIGKNNDKMIAKYFSNVGKKFAGKIPNPKKSVEYYLNKLQSNHKSLYFDPCDESEIKELINKLPLKSS